MARSQIQRGIGFFPVTHPQGRDSLPAPHRSGRHTAAQKKLPPAGEGAGNGCCRHGTPAGGV